MSDYVPTKHERESAEAREALWNNLGRRPDELFAIASALTAAEERGRRSGVEEERAMWRHSRFAIAILVQRLGGDALITKSEMVRLDGRTVIETSTELDGLRIRVLPPESGARRRAEGNVTTQSVRIQPAQRSGT